MRIGMLWEFVLVASFAVGYGIGTAWCRFEDWLRGVFRYRERDGES